LGDDLNSPTASALITDLLLKRLRHP